MHMKFFNAPTMTDSKEIVGLEMGAKSINVACRNEKKGSVTTAAMDNLKNTSYHSQLRKSCSYSSKRRSHGNG